MQAKRLVERWAHRRGLVSLEAFRRITLPNVEGPEGCRWLEEQLNLEPPPAITKGLAAALGPEIRLHDCISLDGAGLPFVPPPLEPLPSVDEAFAALAAEFSAPEAALTPSPAPPAFAEAHSLWTETPEAQIPQTVVPEPDPPEAEAWTDEAAGVCPPQRRFSFRRVRSLMRDCLEEAMGSLRVGAAPAAPLPVDSAPQEPLAPPPTFHPTAPLLASLREPAAREVSEPGLPGWLPRLGTGAPSRRPAPAPSDLADLRAWLPDDDDLPRAC